MENKTLNDSFMYRSVRNLQDLERAKNRFVEVIFGSPIEPTFMLYEGIRNKKHAFALAFPNRRKIYSYRGSKLEFVQSRENDVFQVKLIRGSRPIFYEDGFEDFDRVAPALKKLKGQLGGLA